MIFYFQILTKDVIWSLTKKLRLEYWISQYCYWQTRGQQFILPSYLVYIWNIPEDNCLQKYKLVFHLFTDFWKIICKKNKYLFSAFYMEAHKNIAQIQIFDWWLEWQISYRFFSYSNLTLWCCFYFYWAYLS